MLEQVVVVKTVRSGCVPRDSPPDFIPRAFASARARDVQLFSCFQTAAKEFIIRFDWMIDAGQSPLAGTNLDIGAADIMIDGIACVVQSASATAIVCTVGERSAIPSENTFTVSVGGNKAILHQKFMYVMRYSDPRTWGTDVPPIEGDLVYVPEGMTLYMDETTPQLEGIITLGGNLFFADEADMEIHAGIIVMNGG